MNACKCEEKNYAVIYIPENVVESQVKITGEDWTLLCFFREYDHLCNMATLYCLFMAMNNYLLDIRAWICSVI